MFFHEHIILLEVVRYMFTEVVLRRVISNLKLCIVSQMEVDVSDGKVEVIGKGIFESLRMARIMKKIVFVSFPKHKGGKKYIFDEGRFNVVLLPVRKPSIGVGLIPSIKAFFQSYLNYVKVTLFLSKIMNNEAVDLIRVENILLLGVPIAILSKFKNIPYVLWIAGPELRVIEIKLSHLKPLVIISSLLFKLLARFVIRNAAAVISISPESNELILSMRPRLYRYLDANYVDVETFSPRKCNINKGKYVILYVGRLEKEKGIKLLINSIEKLANLRNDFELWVVGYGSMYNYLREHNEKGLPIKLFGKKNIGELLTYYNRADIFIFPSLVEGPSAALLEAMACGVPVITTTGPIKDRETGILVNRDPASIANAIDFLLNNSELRAKISENEFNFVKRLSKRYLRTIFAVYIAALKSSGHFSAH